MASSATDVPPGLHADGRLSVLAESGSMDWMPFEKTKLYTNAFVRQDSKLLLGFKKRGLGKGLYNGFGGKVDPGETPAEAAVRELKEEAGITAKLEHRGTLFFMSPEIAEAARIEVYYAEDFDGNITESEEMRPEWFAIPDTDARHHHIIQNPRQVDGTSGLRFIPYDEMWEDDAVWLPAFLSGRHFIGRADFGTAGRLQKWWFALKS
ncbi:NUDIX hydrolase domain-like protein [Fomitopsis serialis]|uniref:NUDIX hydrolase domain-like protein n=1 Tax=Fomitopsis serialis TaxID=139415 RepID=UPI0020088682|nr:NUDIX hydrolase domain-like protein [Neoantrodia serialis]KAH9932216.1 NUDIX hydrolase domain-like protein [Neoantrodia serialis]